MKITKQNYPEYFLDYHEGRLSEAARAELMDFLARHPELKDEFEGFGLAFLDPDPTIEFPGKASLKRGEVTPDNYDWYFSAYVSGDLSPAGMAAVEAFADTDPRYAHELSLMQHTLLEADTSVVFEGKSTLKRHVIGAGAAGAAGGAVAGTVSGATDGALGGPAAGAAGGSDAGAAGGSDAGAAAAGFDAGAGAATTPGMGAAKTRSLFAVSGKLWYYTSAAAVVMIMAGLFFMWGPDSPMTGPGSTGPALGYETPAAGLEDQPEAVAEVPPPQQVSSDTQTDAVASADRVPVAGTERASSVVPSAGTDRTPVSGTAGERLPAAGIDADRMAAPSIVRPLIAGLASSAQTSGFTREMPQADLQQKTEFAYWDARMVSADALAAGGYDLSVQQTSLSQMARNRLQESLPVDRERAETLVAEGGNSLRNIAQTGIGTLERLASSLLSPEPLPEEEGRQVQFALGNVLRVSRSSTPE
jgi:hypothetical protein